MTDCPHIHEQDTAIQAFSDIIREETDGGRDLVRFFTNTMSGKGFMFDEINRAEPHSAYKDWCVSNRINPSVPAASTSPSGRSSESIRTTPTDAGCSGAFSSSLKRSRRGQKVQEVHKQCRNDS